jgi:hypothetical protein
MENQALWLTVGGNRQVEPLADGKPSQIHLVRQGLSDGKGVLVVNPDGPEGAEQRLALGELQGDFAFRHAVAKLRQFGLPGRGRFARRRNVIAAIGPAGVRAYGQRHKDNDADMEEGDSAESIPDPPQRLGCHRAILHDCNNANIAESGDEFTLTVSLATF